MSCRINPLEIFIFHIDKNNYKKSCDTRWTAFFLGKDNIYSTLLKKPSRVIEFL